MKVVLRQDVPKLGKKGDVKEVSDGFARNCLIPQGKCDIATPGAIKRITLRQEKEVAHKEASDEARMACAKKAQEAGVSLTRTANEDGTLFAAVSVEELLAYIEEHCGAGLSSKDIDTTDPLKHVGEHTISVAGLPVVVTIAAE